MRPLALRPSLALALLGLCAAGCLDGFKTPSAYAEATYPCDDGSFPSRVAACLSDPACGGAVGMRGTLDGNAIVVDTQLKRSGFEIVTETTTLVPQLDVAEGTGASPYFSFTLTLRSVGRAEHVARSDATAMQVAANAPSLPLHLEDNVLALDLRVSAAGESIDLPANDGSGQVLITERAAGRLQGLFSVTLGAAAEPMTGCFSYAALEERVVGAK